MSNEFVTERVKDKSAVWPNYVVPMSKRVLKDGRTAYDFDCPRLAWALGFDDYDGRLGTRDRNGHIDYLDWMPSEEASNRAAISYLFEAAEYGSVTVLSTGVVEVFNPNRGEFDLGLNAMRALACYKDDLAENVFRWVCCWENLNIFKEIEEEEMSLLGVNENGQVVQGPRIAR